MNKIHSLLLIAYSILSLSRITSATLRLQCNIPRNFSILLSNEQTAIFYNSELKIRLEDEALVITTYEGKDIVNIQAKEDVTINFTGNLVMLDINSGIGTEPVEISETFRDRISGIGKRSLLNSTDKEIDQCRLVLLPVEMDWPKIHQRMVNEIRRMSESCIELEICPNIDEIGVIAKPDPPIAMALNSTDPITIATDPWKLSYPQGCNDTLYSETVQLAINKIVDVAVSDSIAKLIGTKNGPIIVPNIDTSFHTGSGILKTTGHFSATDGTFRGLSTIRRIADVKLSREGMKFMGSGAFGLKIADVDFARYKLKYGLVKVSGRMSGMVNGVALMARVAVDYNKKPCILSVEHLKVSEFGKMTIELTGLGLLNRPVSGILNWITATWRDDIIYTIEKELRTTMEAQLSTLDCERIRP